MDVQNQWRSQSAAVARAQHGHTTFASSLVPRPRPAFSGLQYGNGEATRGVWGMLPQKILSFLGRFWGYFRPYRCLELEHFDNAFATNLRARSVSSLWYLRQTHIHRDQYFRKSLSQLALQEPGLGTVGSVPCKRLFHVLVKRCTRWAGSSLEFEQHSSEVR